MRTKDPLDQAVKRVELAKKEMERAACKHPHLHFQNAGHQIRCVDCKRYWIAGLVMPRGNESTITDFAYRNPSILDSEFRHSPNESPRTAPVPKKGDKKIR